MPGRRTAFYRGAFTFLIASLAACDRSSERRTKQAAAAASSHAPPPGSHAPVPSSRAPAPAASQSALASDAGSSVPFGRSDCRDPHAEYHFFAEGSLVPKSVSATADLMLRESYSRALATMSEPSLSCAESARAAYRLLILPWRGPQLAVRVEGNSLSLVILQGKGRHSARRLTRAERRLFEVALAKAELWTTPANNFDHMGQDGSTWVIEARAASRYRVVQRWSPESGAFHALARSMIALAGCDADQLTEARLNAGPRCTAW